MRVKWLVKPAQCLLLAILFTGGASSPQLRAQESTSHRKVLVRVEPEYPNALRRAQITSQVRLSVTIAASGKVLQAEVQGGNPILAENAQQAVMKWKFAPAPTQTVEQIWFSFGSH